MLAMPLLTILDCQLRPQVPYLAGAGSKTILIRKCRNDELKIECALFSLTRVG